MVRNTNRRAARVGLSAAALGAALACAGWQLSSENVSAELDGGRLTIGAVRPELGLVGAALAQAGQTVTLENVTFESATTTYRLPRIDFVGVSLSRDLLIALLDARSAEPWPVRLARLSAERVTAPSITVEQRVGPQVQTSTYRNVVAVGLKEGRIATVTSDGVALLTTGGPRGDLSGTVGLLTISDLDLPAHVALYTERTGDRAGPLRRIYGGFSMETLSIGDAAGLSIKVARASGRDFLARPTRDGWDSFIRALEPGGNGAKLTPAAGFKQFGLLADIYGSVGVGSIELSGLELRDGKPDTAVAVTLAKVAYAGSVDGQPPELRFEDVAFAGKDGGGRFGRIGFTGFSFASTIEGLKALADAPADQVGPDDLRKLIPTIGTVRLADLDVETTPSAAPGEPKPDRVRFGVRSIELTADKPINGVPTRFASSVQNVTFPLPATPTDDTLRRLAAMGYRNLDLSFASAADWIEASSELQVRELSLQGKDMGGVTLRATIGNVTRDAFDPDSAVAAVALLGATLRDLELTVEDRGLADRLVAQESRQRKVRAEDLRREYGVAAAVGVPALLGNSAQSKAVAQAIARFLAKPGRLVIAAKTKDPAGLGAADLAALGDPASVLERLDISARAE